MESIVIIRNVSNNQETTIPAAQWRQIKNSPQWRGVFTLLRLIKEPPEVVALKAKKAAENKGQ